MLAPVADGYEVTSGAWPEHLTLAGNFFTAAPLEEVAAQVREILLGSPSFTLHAIAEDRLGEAGEYRVLTLDLPPELQKLHGRLTALVHKVGRYEHPEYTGHNYKPHVTIQPKSMLNVGQEFKVASGTVFEIDNHLLRRRAVESVSFR